MLIRTTLYLSGGSCPQAPRPSTPAATRKTRVRLSIREVYRDAKREPRGFPSPADLGASPPVEWLHGRLQSDARARREDGRRMQLLPPRPRPTLDPCESFRASPWVLGLALAVAFGVIGLAVRFLGPELRG